MKEPVRDKSDIHRVIGILAERSDVLEILASVSDLNLPDGWVGAGVIRNAVWDAVTGSTVRQPASDVDVVYFDRCDATPDRDRALEEAIAIAHPGLRWSVKNQARMHRRAGDLPYSSTTDAISRWPETCTAVAARFALDQIEVIAPWGLTDLLRLIVRPTPAFELKQESFNDRVRAKAWIARWPGITVIPASTKAAP
jgi:uncharacterized protein